MTKILFVCLGNICRSPLAEAIFNHKVAELGLSSRFRAESAGTSNYHIGEPPDERTIQNALKNGITMNHTGRQLKAKDLEEYDYVFAMDNNNHKGILRLAKGTEPTATIALIRDYDEIERGSEVPDPYFGGEEGFQEVFEMLDRSIDNLIAELTKTE